MNLDTSLNIDEEELNRSFTITIKGSSSKINSLEKEDIDLRLDLRDLEEGTHKVNPEIIAEDGIEIISVIPESFDITLVPE